MWQIAGNRLLPLDTALLPRLIAQYETLHHTRRYGATSAKGAPWILPHVRSLRPRSVHDYGCGQSVLPDIIAADAGCSVIRYDPAIPAHADRPCEAADLLVNVDVLEHIPEPELGAVIQDMALLGREAIIIVDTRVARTILPSGENAHATVRPVAWWRERLRAFFPNLESIAYGPPQRASFRTWPYRRGGRSLLMLQTAYYRAMRAGRPISRPSSNILFRPLLPRT